MADKNRWISFTDLDTGAEAGVGIRQVEGGFGLTISHRQDGDIEALLPPSAVEELIDALNSVGGQKSA
jgi:hypothetical protein